jgi:hypothetical protein
MAVCDVCGNDYDKTFEIIGPDGSRHTFDSFECAVHELAPRCAHCGCRILGHGIESENTFFCCAQGAKRFGVHGARDRVEPGRQASPAR